MDRRAAVRATYDRIAEHFAATREYAWPEVESFLADLETDDSDAAELGADDPDATGPGPGDADATGLEAGGAIGLDIGCGNCRHAEPLAERVDDIVGLDVSRGLLETGRERASERGFAVDLVQGDAAALPLSDDSVAVAVYVATLHHLPTRTMRRESLDELARVLAPEGRALISAWSTAHDRFDADESFDTTVEWTLPDGETVDRFYHIYSPADFEADLEASALRVASVEISSGNCYATARGR